MAPHGHRPSLSITLPPSFQFHYSDGQLPKTPDEQATEQAPMNPPPPPRPSTFKVRRRRTTIPEFQEEEAASADTAIPTIEMSEAASDISSPILQPTPASHGLLAPLSASVPRDVTPPKTPAPRVNAGFSSTTESPANEWAMISDGNNTLRPAFERSGSVCSSFSDSSVSSCGSSAFSAPHNGSCTSPASEATDPFLDDELPKTQEHFLNSPDPHSSSPVAKRVKTHRHIKWTQAMDDHLWMTYMQYITDPRVTPFKMLPGTCPPLGVCSRVASKARRTWSSHRASTPAVDAGMTSEQTKRDGSPDTIRPEAKELKQPQWPRSDANTRRRLRSLCKRKPSLSAHYQRLLRTRSPSPFPSSEMGVQSEQPPPASSAFSGGDMKMSLVTSTAPSMQPDAPLAKLASNDTPAQPPRPRSQRTSRPADWFARIPRSQAHQKSLSLQSGLNLNANTHATYQQAGVLASPFDDAANKSHLLQSMNTTKSLGRTAFNMDGKAPTLDSPFESSGAPTLPRTSLKRRFRSDEEKPKRPGLNDVFSSGAPSGEGAGIVRNRGFTVGAARATDNLTKLFATPASTVDHEMGEASAPAAPSSDFGPAGSRSVPRRLAEPVPRLGSPFIEAANRQHNTFPRTYIPSSSNPTPFQSRLRELAGDNTPASNTASDDVF